MMDFIGRLFVGGHNPRQQVSGSSSVGNSVKQFLGASLRRKDQATSSIPRESGEVNTDKQVQGRSVERQESYESIEDASKPFVDILCDIKASVENPEQYLMDHPDLLLSLFKSHPEDMLQTIEYRLEMLKKDVGTWVGDRERANTQIDELNRLLNELDESLSESDSIAKMKELLKALRDHEEQYGKTPYEDLCKAALLFNPEKDTKAFEQFFDKELLDDDFMDFVDPERSDIHKSPKRQLQTFLGQRIQAYRIERQRYALQTLEESSSATVLAQNLGEDSTSGLYARFIKIPEMLGLAMRWLTAGIREGWGHNGSSQALEKELAENSGSPEALTSWLEAEDNQALKHSLQKGVAITHVKHAINTMQAKLDSGAVDSSESKGYLAWCGNCQSLMSEYNDELCAEMLERIDQIRSALMARLGREMYNSSPLAAILSYEDCESQPYLKAKLDALNKANLKLAELKTKPVRDVSITAEAEASSLVFNAQMELLFSYGHHIVSEDSSQDTTARLDQICRVITTIDHKRSGPVALRNHDKGMVGRWWQVGAKVLQGNEEPVEMRLRKLKLKHQLLLDGYDYQQEKQEIFSRLYSATGKLGIVGEEACDRLYKDRGNPVKLLWDLLNVKNGVCEQVSGVLSKEFFEDFKALMKRQPRMARNMMGDIAQSTAMVKQVFGDSSVLGRLFEQLDWRAWGETAQSYVNERFSEPYREFQELSSKEKESVKRMYALCEMLKEAPPTLQAAKAVVNVGKNLAVGNLGNAAYEGAKGAVELWGVQKIQHDVGVMSDDEVRTLHMALSTLQHGPAETMIRMDAMRRSANMLADTVKGTSLLKTGFLNSELMRPFVFRYNRLTLAIKEYWHGQGSGKRLALELGKVGLIVGGAVGVLALSAATAGGFAAALGVASASWATVVMVTGFSIPTLLASLAAGQPFGAPFLYAAHAIAQKLMYAENLESPAMVVKNLLCELKDDPKNQLSQLKVNLGGSIGKKLRTNPWAKAQHDLAMARETCQQAYIQYWEHFLGSCPEQATEVMAVVDKLLPDDGTELNQQAGQLHQKLQDWKTLSEFIKEMPADASLCRARLDALNLGTSVKRLLSGDGKHLSYNVFIVLEMLQEELTQQLGVEMDWDTGHITMPAHTPMSDEGSATSGNKEAQVIRLDKPADIRRRLQDYQMALLLGDVLCRRYLDEDTKVEKARKTADKVVSERMEKQCAKQVSETVDMLLRNAVSHLVTVEQGEAEKMDEDLARRSLANDQRLKRALEVEQSALKTAAEHCVKERFKVIQGQLDSIGIDMPEGQLPKLLGEMPQIQRSYSDQEIPHVDQREGLPGGQRKDSRWQGPSSYVSS